MPASPGSRFTWCSVAFSYRHIRGHTDGRAAGGSQGGGTWRSRGTPRMGCVRARVTGPPRGVVWILPVGSCLTFTPVIPFCASDLELYRNICLFTCLSPLFISFIHSFYKEIRQAPHASGLDIKGSGGEIASLIKPGAGQRVGLYHVHFLQEGKYAHLGPPCSAHCLNSRLYRVDHVCMCVCTHTPSDTRQN